MDQCGGSMNMVMECNGNKRPLERMIYDDLRVPPF